MGNNAKANFRGDDDVILTAAINGMDDAEFASFLEEGEACGKFDAKDLDTKAKILAALGGFSEAEKKAVVENLKAGKGPFD